MSYALAMRRGLGYTGPAFGPPDGPDPFRVAVRDGLVPDSEAGYNTLQEAVAMGAGGNTPSGVTRYPVPLLALYNAWASAQASASNRLNLSPSEFVQNMDNNRWGFPSTVPEATVQQYREAFLRYFQEFLTAWAAWYKTPAGSVSVPSAPAPSATVDARYPVGVQLVMGWRYPIPGDALMRDAWPVVPLSAVVGFRLVQPMTNGDLAEIQGYQPLPRVFVVRQFPNFQYDGAKSSGWYPLVWSETIPGVAWPTGIRPDANTPANVQSDEASLLAFLNGLSNVRLVAPWGGLPQVGPAPGVAPGGVVTLQPWTDAAPRPPGWTDTTAPGAPVADVPLVQGPDGVWVPSGAVALPGGGYTMPGTDGEASAGAGEGIQAAGMSGLFGLALLGLVLAGTMKGKARVRS